MLAEIFFGLVAWYLVGLAAAGQYISYTIQQFPSIISSSYKRDVAFSYRVAVLGPTILVVNLLTGVGFYPVTLPGGITHRVLAGKI